MFQPHRRTASLNPHNLPINTDFRLMCEFSVAIDKGDTEKLSEIIERFYYAGIGEVSPKDAIKGIEEFYLEGISPEHKNDELSDSPTTTSHTVPCFDFSVDEGYFYSAYMSEYGVDLNTIQLHWFDFCALFRGLSDDCKLKQIMSIRSKNLNDIKNVSERNRIRKLQRMFSLNKKIEKRFENVEQRNNAMIDRINRRYEEMEKLKKGGK